MTDKPENIMKFESADGQWVEVKTARKQVFNYGGGHVVHTQGKYRNRFAIGLQNSLNKLPMGFLRKDKKVVTVGNEVILTFKTEKQRDAVFAALTSHVKEKRRTK